MDTETEMLIAVLRSRMEKMSDDERMELMHALMNGYCENCGGEYLPCYCTQDE